MALPGAVDMVSKVRRFFRYWHTWPVEALMQLASHPSSKNKWTIVTSGKIRFTCTFLLTVTITLHVASNKYAPRALERAGVPLPSVGIITANDVSQGKPHPAPYLAGALKCSVEPKNCGIFICKCYAL